jgi:hypothetical protein
VRVCGRGGIDCLRWSYASLSYDGHVVLSQVPESLKYSILF